MGKLFYTEKSFIGLDINTTDVKIMSIDPERWVVLGYGAVDVDPKKIKSALEDGGTYLEFAIKKLISEKLVGSLSSHQVVLGLPTSRTYSRTFSVPNDAVKTPKALKEAVELEAGQYIPVPVDLLSLDYEVIEKNKETTTVILCAAPLATTKNAINAVESAGLQVNAIEPSINSVARVLKTTEDAELTTLIVDIGPANTDIAVLDKIIRVTGGTNVGGNTFTLDIAKKLSVALENAHQLKVLNGLNPGSRQAKIKKALQPNLTRIAEEIRRVMRYYKERINDSKKIEQILIVGSGSNLPGIGEYFTNELIMPVRVASPWQKLDFGNLKEPAKQFRPRYIAVAGLASVTEKDVWGGER